MAVEVVWGIPVALFALCVLADGVLFFNGLYQVLTAKPAFLPFRLFRTRRKRVPASPVDCSLQGSAQMLQAVGLSLVIGVSTIPLVTSALELTGAAHPPPLATISPVLVVAGLAYVLLSFAMAVLCIGASLALNLRVRYVDDPDGFVAPAQ
jgi:hypothetical protein